MYVGIYGASLVLALLTIIFLAAFGLIANQFPALKREPQPLQNIISIIGFIGICQFLLVAAIYPFVLLAKMWGAIQDGQARATSAKAIGFLFIPFYNLYWIFQAWGGFPTDYNRYVERHQLPVSPLSSGLFVVYPILLLLSVIPLVGILAAIVSLFVVLMITVTTCDAVNALADTV